LADRPAVSAGAVPRVAGVDVARGLAVTLMVQGHAFDAFISTEARASFAYRIESAFLQTLALPAFLVLAGASFALRVEAAAQRDEPVRDVRRAIVRRGFAIVLAGYAFNAFSALLDGWEGVETWLRADVLHVIGLSIAWLGAIGLRAERPRTQRASEGGPERGIDRAHLGRTALATAILPILLGPLVSSVSPRVPREIGWVLGLVADVPGVTRMPMIPLTAWTAIGLILARWMIERNRAARSPAGAPDRDLACIAAVATAVAIAFAALTQRLVDLLGGALTRAHPAVIANAIDLAARGALVLAVGAWLAPRLPRRFRAAMIRLGRGSLVAYVFHVPLCYGRLARWLEGRLSLLECALAALGLVVASFLAVVARDALRETWRRRRRAKRADS
jgi:uncharacterized membrane protein